MKRLSTMIVALIILAFCCPLRVFAHPGKTDGSGGHYNRSTGTYHYHHGYPEHKHYDMDGDGKIDCPYDFNDKTSENSERSSDNSKSKKKTDAISEVRGSIPEKVSQSELKIKENRKNSTFLMASMMVCSVAVFLFPILLKKESFSDCMGCVVESYMMIIFLLVFLLVCWMALEYLDGLMHLEFITKQFSDYVNDTIYSIAIAVFICIICGFRLIDKEKLDGAEICTVFVLVCHAIIALAANEVVCFSVTVTLYLTVSIFLIALILTILSYKYGK